MTFKFESAPATRRTILGGLALALAIGGLSLAPVAARAEDKAIKVGIIGGEDEDLWRIVVEEGKKHGLAIETVVFSDYTQPNEALERGEVDANAFQHKPYLDNQIQTQGYHITPVGYTAVWPIGLYSRKFKSIGDITEGAVIGVPNDPSNEGRALRVLQAEGLIKLKDGTGILATATDIVENPKKLEIKELDAGIVGRSIDDLDAAVVNTDWALKSGLKPETDRIAQESAQDNPYNNFIAVKTDRKDEAWVKDLVASYQNDRVKEGIVAIYKGTGQAAW
ncbi:MetQ/NlpA family ABC transporter substrate-binding protein [Kaistia terrae]|uniref:Lipoprotein n=1 Tax=Kaistia terrae TaxID=537017 RepID=A0ABW0PRF0_9HYPH|nr:MetQ/NlpA family lipoprotein [Kaistia terrae]MCX5578455.1 MetQ/NlpA family lipoprotein [Kaistia terrae]